MLGHIRIRLLLFLLAGVLLVACLPQVAQVTTTPANSPTAEIASTETATPGALATGTSEASETPLPPTATPPAAPTITPTPAPSNTPIPGATPTVTPPPSVSPDPTPPVTVASSPMPTPTITSALAIHHFELVSQEEMNPGKRLTFSWSAEGDMARLLAGTQMRFMPWWEVPLNGTMTIELERTLFPDPDVTFQVFGPPDEQGLRGDPLFESINIPWACEHDYFFSPAPERCPRDAATMPAAAQQAFEGGRMVWLQPEDKILVLFDQELPGTGGAMVSRVYDDTWTAGEPESDPTIDPPPGLCQPVRGFGKVWRNNPEVRDGLGWALAPESAYTATWQFEFNESIGTTSYLRLDDGRIARIVGYYTGYGNWSYLDS